MLGPETDGQRSFRALWDRHGAAEELGLAIPRLGAEEIHAGRTDEARDEQVRGRSNIVSGSAICWISPSRMMTMRFAMVMASIWSCVT